MAKYMSLLLLFGATSVSQNPGVTVEPLLVRAEVIKSLSAKAAEKSFKVQLRGVVTYVDPDRRVFYLHDESSGIRIETEQPVRQLQPRLLVEVAGVSAPGSIVPFVTQARVTVLGSANFPDARKTPLSGINLKKDDGQWLEFDNLIVQNAYQEGRHAVLDAYERDRRIQIRLTGFPQGLAGNIIDARIRARGVLSATTDAARNPVVLMLWVPEGETVKVLQAPSDDQSLPITSIVALEKRWDTNPPLHRVRIRGTIAPGERENTLLIQDGTGLISAQPLFFRPIGPGDEVDLTGFADLRSPVPRLVNANYFRIKAPAIESSRDPGLPTLTSMSRIRRLDSKEAGRGYPVRIRGVITYHNPELAMTFIQNGTDALFLVSLDPNLSLSEGMEYEVEGFSAPGDFSPIVIEPKFRLIGPARLPKPKRVSPHELNTGESDCLLVEMDGIVRAVRQVGNIWSLEIYSGGRSTEVWLPNLPQSGSVTLQDARILVQGICSIQITPWGTIRGFRINATSADQIKIEEPAPYDPFDAPLRTIRDLFRYSNREQSGRRVRIEGILLHQQPGRALYIKDDTGTIAVPVSHIMPVSANDIVAVSGYPSPGGYTPMLEHALVKRLGSGSPPPIPLTPSVQALNGNSHGNLVKIRAILVNQWRASTGQSYILQEHGDSGASFQALLETGTAETPEIRNGSEVELTGIHLLQVGSQKSALRFLLRTPQDIRLIKAAPWWTIKHFYWASALLFCLILGTTAWVAILRTRVKQQTAIIQHRLEAEAALKTKYQELFEGSLDIVFACDASGRLTSINPSGSRILGYSNEEFMRMDPAALIAPESLPQVSEWIRLKAAGIACPNLECELTSKDGRKVPVEVNAKIFRNKGGITGAQGIARDITERKNADEALRRSEEKLRQGQKLESIGRLAGGIAHDFNNILSAILGYAELSIDELPPEHEVRPNLEQIAKAGQRARDLVQQILAFSRKLEQEHRPVLLQTIVDETLKLLKATLPATIQITTRISPGCSPVLADSTQMHQVLLNLATNAAHAIGGSEGVIQIELDQTELDGDGDLAPGQYVCLSVSDTGCGISPEVQKRIFEPYFTTKSVGEGSGLGLAVVHGIVQSHGGAITLTSAPGQGSCFRVYLPCHSGEADSVAQPAVEFVKGKGRILLVDDEEAIVNLGMRSLSKLGYEVTGETHSADALKKFRENPDKFDLVVTDQTMPQLTGLSLAQELWKIRPKLPVIISTGYSEQITSDKAAELGFQALLSKPYSTSELANAIKQSLA